ncbi:MAG: glycosyltransferase [Actinomycetota bacterium]|nr:glycosyltransferase [Actinomycetota bacterium]
MHLSVVVPTRNEAGNVASLVARLAVALEPLALSWDVIFVDDSDDDTPTRIAALAEDDHPVALIHRRACQRQGGLSGAVALGFERALGERAVGERAVGADVVALMDGDLQHRPEVVPALVSAIADGADVAIASRAARLANGGTGMAKWWRGWVSRSARSLVYASFPALRSVRDPLAGFFATRRQVIVDVPLRPEGFKILLEVLVRGEWNSVAEVACELDPRLHGRSKAHVGQGIAFLRHLLRLRQGRYRPDPVDLAPARVPDGS